MKKSTSYLFCLFFISNIYSQSQDHAVLSCSNLTQKIDLDSINKAVTSFSLYSAQLTMNVINNNNKKSNHSDTNSKGLSEGASFDSFLLENFLRRYNNK